MELIKSLLALIDCALDNELLSFNVIGFKFHWFPTVYSILKQKYVKHLRLSVKYSTATLNQFQSKMKHAVKAYQID